MTEGNILGCFVSSMNGDNKGETFRDYIWSENGIDKYLKKVNNTDYGKDMLLILFKFYVNPILYLEQNLKPIENYRKNEKSIGIPIIVNNENFFNKSEQDRYVFLKESILEKLDLLSELVKKKKLDTDVEKLKSDVRTILK